MLILDSNIWIAYLNRDDSCNLDARKIFEKIAGRKITMPLMVMFEVATVLRLKVHGDVANKFVKLILASERIEILNLNEKEIKTFGVFFESSAERKLSMVDELLRYLHFERKAEILTLDKDLMKALA